MAEYDGKVSVGEEGGQRTECVAKSLNVGREARVVMRGSVTRSGHQHITSKIQ